LAFDTGPNQAPGAGKTIVQRQFTLEDVSFRQPKLAFQVQWRQHLSITNQLFNIRRVFGDRIDNSCRQIRLFFSSHVPSFKL
jgi:hypothetical protein